MIPNVCGISIWSPRLDSVGNSQRGVRAATELCKRLSLNPFEVFSGLSETKHNLLTPKWSEHRAQLADVCFAASWGDVSALKMMQHSGADLFSSDYDGRTALHLAAAEGHLDAVRFLVEAAPATQRASVVNARDRWGGTPLDDATRTSNSATAAVLRQAGGVPGTCIAMGRELDEDEDGGVIVIADAPRILFSAAEGNIDALVKFSSQGLELHAGDYDRRTALHLAACEGHVGSVHYLVGQTADHDKVEVLQARDRWGNTPYDDSMREGHPALANYLKTALHDALLRPASRHASPVAGSVLLPSI